MIDQLYLDRLRSSVPTKAAGKITRFRIRGRGDVVSEPLSDASVELPRFDDVRCAGRRYRFLYGAGQEPSGDFFNSLVKFDLDRCRVATWHDAGCYPGEPVFVADPQNADEDSGVILSVVLDTRRGTSFLLVLDASTFIELAKIEAPHTIPFGFHGNYLDRPAE